MDKRAFLQFLIQTNKINKSELLQCLEESVAQKKTLVALLLEKKLFSPASLKDALQEFNRSKQETLLIPEQNKIFSEEETNKILLDFDADSQMETIAANAFPSSELKKKFLGKYEILSEIAKGGMGVVYKVYHKELAKNFALKVILAGKLASDEDVARFHHEAKTTAKLRHPFIVQVVDSGEEDGHHYLCMELVEGETLKEKLKQKMPIRTLLKLFQSVLEGLHYAHKQNVIHRDLKPANIFVTPSEEPKIVDFGLAKDLSLNASSHQLTKSGEVLGTPAYMSPEQVVAAGQKLNSSVDIYAAGACLYEALTGICPFEGKTVHELFYKIISEDPVPPSKLNPKIHRDLDIIILKALDKSKNRRYLSAKAFAEDIRRFLEGYPILARPIGIQERSKKWIQRNSKLFLLSVLFVFLGASFIGYERWRRHQQKIKLKEQKFNQYQKYLQQSNEKLLETKGIKEDTYKGSSRKIALLLEALNRINLALSLDLSSIEKAETQKFEIGRELIRIACQNEDYELAKYIAREIQRLNLISETQKKALQDYVSREQSKKKKQHLARLSYWVETLSLPEIEIGVREEALLEISKMPEKEVFEKILSQVKMGTNYFLDGTKRTVKKDEFYETMVQALGQLENPAAGEVLMLSLEKIAEKMLQYKAGIKPVAEIQYMVALAQALGNAKTLNMALRLQNIRFLMGLNGLFWNRSSYVFTNLAELDQLENKNPSSANDYFLRAFYRLDQKKYQAAISDLDQALRLNPKLANGYAQRGLAKSEIKDFKGSLQDYNKAIQLQPNVSYYYNNRGATKSENGNIEGAIKDYSEAIRLNPSNFNAYNNRGMAKHNQKKYQLALQDFTQGIQINPQNAELYNNRGITREKLGDFKGSLNDFTLAIQLNPKYSSPYVNRALLKEAANQFEEALEDYNKAIRLNPQDASHYNNRGALKVKLGDVSGGILDYNEALRLESKLDQVYLNRGKAQEELKQRKLALKDYTQAILLNPKNSAAYFCRGMLKAQQGNKNEAREDFLNYLKLIKKDKSLDAKLARQAIYFSFPELKGK